MSKARNKFYIIAILMLMAAFLLCPATYALADDSGAEPFGEYADYGNEGDPEDADDVPTTPEPEEPSSARPEESANDPDENSNNSPENELEDKTEKETEKETEDETIDEKENEQEEQQEDAQEDVADEIAEDKPEDVTEEEPEELTELTALALLEQAVLLVAFGAEQDLIDLLEVWNGGGSGSLFASYNESGDIVVTGIVTGALEGLELNIPDGITVLWNAALTSSQTEFNSDYLLSLAGSGKFYLKPGGFLAVFADGVNDVISGRSGVVTIEGTVINHGEAQNPETLVRIAGSEEYDDGHIDILLWMYDMAAFSDGILWRSDDGGDTWYDFTDDPGVELITSDGNQPFHRVRLSISDITVGCIYQMEFPDVGESNKISFAMSGDKPTGTPGGNRQDGDRTVVARPGSGSGGTGSGNQQGGDSGNSGSWDQSGGDEGDSGLWNPSGGDKSDTGSGTQPGDSSEKINTETLSVDGDSDEIDAETLSVDRDSGETVAETLLGGGGSSETDAGNTSESGSITESNSRTNQNVASARTSLKTDLPPLAEMPEPVKEPEATESPSEEETVSSGDRAVESSSGLRAYARRPVSGTAQIEMLNVVAERLPRPESSRLNLTMVIIIAVGSLAALCAVAIIVLRPRQS